jgi:hypothetical protein
MPNLSRSTLYRCLKRRGLSRIGLTAICPPLTKAALKGPYRFEITANQVAWRDPGDVISQGFEVFLAIEEITKDVYAEVAVATPENAAGSYPTWSLNLPKRSLRLLQISFQHSPTGEPGSTKTWRSVLIPSPSPAAPMGSSTLSLSLLMRSPRKSDPEASKSDSEAVRRIASVGGGLSPVGDILLSLRTLEGHDRCPICPACNASMRKKPLEIALKRAGLENLDRSISGFSA